MARTLTDNERHVLAHVVEDPGAYNNETITVIADMDATDTAYTTITVNNSSKTVAVGGGVTYGSFAGCLIS